MPNLQTLAPISTAPMPQRSAFRASSRAVYQNPDSYFHHRERLHAALFLAGNEPAQGALADMLYGCHAEPLERKARALSIVNDRLSVTYQRWFEPYIQGDKFPSCSRLATRWSVLVRPSVEVPRREMRCSFDDSQTLARAAITAWQTGDQTAQEEFLQHCWVCRDALAFMLARREILRTQDALPDRWAAVCLFLQEAGEAQ